MIRFRNVKESELSTVCTYVGMYNVLTHVICLFLLCSSSTSGTHPVPATCSVV